jgi:hypothetical protein
VEPVAVESLAAVEAGEVGIMVGEVVVHLEVGVPAGLLGHKPVVLTARL